MNGVIVTTHGSFASGLYSTLKMIAGEFENIVIVEFKENNTLESVDERLKEAYEKLSDCKNILVLTDLAGGTPFNRSVMTLSDKENVRFLSGLNFAMLYQALTSDTEEIDSLVEEIIDTSKESITFYQTNNSNQTEDDVDGI